MSSKRATMERLPFHFMSGFSSRLRGFVIILTALVYVSLVMLLEEDMSGGGRRGKRGLTLYAAFSSSYLCLSVAAFSS